MTLLLRLFSLLLPLLLVGCLAPEEEEAATDESYQLGFAAGREAGLAAGDAAGLTRGLLQGSQEGYAAGYEAGYRSGFADAENGGEELPDGPVRLSVADIVVRERNSGQSAIGRFSVVLSRPLVSDLRVTYFTRVPNDPRHPAATAGSSCEVDIDYIAVSYSSFFPRSITIAAGAVAGEIEITICGDELLEDNEVFEIEVQVDAVADLIVMNTTATATILDDEKFRRLNDTGITCAANTRGYHDCLFGRDSTHNNNADGHAGFSFTKLDAAGGELAATESSWACVRDNNTNLVWEIKLNNPESVRDRNRLFRWGGDTAQIEVGQEYGNRYNDWDALLAAANGERLCGYDDWRLPSVGELYSLVNLNQFNAAIDASWFGESGAQPFWSATPHAYYVDYAWLVSFFDGQVHYAIRDQSHRVRLVRAGS
jgi:hypothetical protein